MRYYVIWLSSDGFASHSEIMDAPEISTARRRMGYRLNKRSNPQVEGTVGFVIVKANLDFLSRYRKYDQNTNTQPHPVTNEEACMTVPHLIRPGSTKADYTKTQLRKAGVSEADVDTILGS